MTNIFVVLMAILGGVWGCSPSSEKSLVESSTNKKVTELILINWVEYTDMAVMEAFERETGIKPILKEYGQAAELISKLQAAPADYDIIITDNTTIPFFVKSRMLHELDHSKLPNLKHIDANFLNADFDPHNRYSIPYTYGTTGLAVNTKYVKGAVDTWHILFDPANKNKIALLDDPREISGALLGYMGISVNTKDREVLQNATQHALALKANGVTLGDYLSLSQQLITGEKWVVMAYSGDLLKISQAYPEIQYVVPKEGSNRWIDSYAVSRYTKKIDAVYAFLNYMMKPQIAASISNSQFYASPNKDAIPYIKKSIMNNPIIHPPKAVIDRCEIMQDTGDLNKEYVRLHSLLK